MINNVEEHEKENENLKAKLGGYSGLKVPVPGKDLKSNLWIKE